MKRLKIAVIHPQPRVGGGSENKALWIVQTLKEQADVYFIVMGTINLEELNKFYGTALTRRDITVIEIPIPFGLKNRFDALRNYRLDRYIRRNSDAFDILISTYNPMNFRKVGIQFLSDFSFDDPMRRKLLAKPKSFRSWVYNKTPIRSAYLKLGRLLSGNSGDGWRNNWTIANSDWGGRLFEKEYLIRSRTIYPPVRDEIDGVPWEKKENGFLSIGRMVPEKQIERAIRVLERVRKDGFNIHLHILGGGNDKAYTKRIIKMISENNDWIEYEGVVFGSRKRELLSGHKYGLHTCENELVGNAVIEMIKAGCMPWVPESGGPAEVVGHKGLIYGNDSEAISKIEKVLGDAEWASSIRKHIESQAKKFSLAAFQAQIRDLIEQFVHQNEAI